VVLQLIRVAIYPPETKGAAREERQRRLKRQIKKQN